MNFSSYSFIVLFLPVVILGYYALTSLRAIRSAKVWLILSSLFFYTRSGLANLPVLLISIAINFVLGRVFESRASANVKRVLLLFGITANLAALVYWKYLWFLFEQCNALLGTSFAVNKMLLPIGISFFTFQQILFLLAAYRGETKDTSLIDYTLFVSFFPQITSGPIVLYKETMPQFRAEETARVHWDNIARGIFLFSIGLFKKAIIADNLAYPVEIGFDRELHPSFVDSTVAIASYVFQIYFDFSGYIDMALGCALMLNIKLPINFNSPLRATNITDFWNRWHITMTRFFMTSIYTPLALHATRRNMQKKRSAKSFAWFLSVLALPTLATFLVAGLWHGAGYMFIAFGAAHGLALIVHRAWQKTGWKMPAVIGWLFTLTFVIAAFVIFRAHSMEQLLHFGRSLCFGYGVGFRNDITPTALFFLGIAFCVSLFPKNSHRLTEELKPSVPSAAFATLLLCASFTNVAKQVEFLYWDF